MNKRKQLTLLMIIAAMVMYLLSCNRNGEELEELVKTVLLGI